MMSRGLSCARYTRICSIVMAALAAASSAAAQGSTSAAIGGRILDREGIGIPGVEVVVKNEATGIAMRAASRAEGRYLVSGLEIGGPYSVTARRIGSPMRTRSGLFLSLGQQQQVDIVLEQTPVTLEAVETRAKERLFSRAHTGAETLLSDSLIHQMPVINRDLYDLARLAPQTSTWFAITASGANPRVNSIQIDGIRDQTLSSNLAAGALYGGKVMPLDAVKEYQVQFSPFDVRHGGFAGAGVNVVTRSGTNDLHGSVFAFGTNEQLGRDVAFIRNTRYDKQQFGLSLGGPIIHDRLLFFVASDVQRRRIPALGPYMDAGMSSESMVPVKSADIARFQQLLTARGLDGGSAGAVTNANPSSSVFVRLDAPLSRWNSRVSVRGTYGYGDSSIFARPTTLAPTNCPTDACFPLSSLQHSRWIDKRSAAVQLISNLPRAAYNELLVGFTGTVAGFRPTVKQPLILVSVPGTGGSTATLQSGTHEIATGQRNTNWSGEVTDNLSFTAGTHRFTTGLSTQFFDLHAFQLRGAYGVWEFASLDSLQLGTASRYRVTRDTGSVTAAHGMYHSLYVGDEWDASPRLSLTFGLRSDIPILRARPPYVGTVDSIFHVRTDYVPSNKIQWSPRVGFNADLTRSGGRGSSTQLRGGVGLFAGTPPLFWLLGGFSAYGLAARTLQCGASTTDAGPAPVFNPDYQNPPTSCGGGQTFAAATSGEIDVIDPALRFPQVIRASLAVDRTLPFGVVGTIEGMYTRSAQAVFYTGINLGEPVAFDHDGRLMYGTIASNGIASPRRLTSRLADVVSIRNQSRDYAYDVTGKLRKAGQFADVSASVSYGRTRDVQSPRPASALLIDDWRFGRPVASREEDMSLTTSDYDQPMRLRASGTIHSPWQRRRTDLSFYYVGGSGLPYTYVAGGAGNRGDLNADGAVGNDPVYIPRAATDTTEIRFSGTAEQVVAQQTGFDRFIDTAPCLSRQRGRIMGRNSCRTPWMNLTNLAVRQTLSEKPPQAFALELQVFNVLNLLNPSWGRVQLPEGAVPATTNQIALMSQTGETTGVQPQPIYRFDTSMRRYSSENYDTYYQIQLAVKYTF
jgi:carboxypeptidase family protein